MLASAPDLSGLSLLEQLVAVEDRLSALNTAATVPEGFAEHLIRQLPPRAVREALLNVVVHRDWLQPDPVSVTWVAADSALQVISPGGLFGGINADNVLTQRYARYPALADLFSALRLVDKRGTGVDRMVREMLALGHRRPTIIEEPGPRVRTRLAGGVPVVPVMNLLGRIEPAVRRRGAPARPAPGRPRLERLCTPSCSPSTIAACSSAARTSPPLRWTETSSAACCWTEAGKPRLPAGMSRRSRPRAT